MAKHARICPFPGIGGKQHRHFSERGVMRCKLRIERHTAKFAKPK